jgi:hypothetical protein
MLPKTSGMKPLRDFDISLEAFLILLDIYCRNLACGTEIFPPSGFNSVR